MNATDVLPNCNILDKVKCKFYRIVVRSAVQCESDHWTSKINISMIEMWTLR